MKSILPKILFTCLSIFILTGCTNQSSNQSNKANQDNQNNTQNQGAKMTKSYNQAPAILPDEQIKNKMAIIETPKGTIKIQLFADDAPLTVSNFVFLTNDNYFDGLTFHRVEPGFVIQGGDPSGNGTGGPGYTFADEPVKKSYDRGIVAMANRGPNTNGSQFFIMLEDTPLPPNYTIFGQVTEGMSVVDKINIGDKMTKITIEDEK